MHPAPLKLLVYQLLEDEEGYRKEFIKLVKKVSALQTADDNVVYSGEE